jgi:acyl-CoA synthetase (AMP-forming)/AMP-acid ligase II
VPTLSSPVRSAGPTFVRELAGFGDRVALHGPDGSATTYAGLAQDAAAIADRLGAGGPRRLVLLGGSNTVGSITAYVGALAAGHVVLLAPGDQPDAIDALLDAYDPDVVIDRPLERDGPAPITDRRPGSRHDLHDELALLLSTSGSTGSPKLVRLSTTNLQTNAAAIVEALGIRGDDRAATTLPMHYTYGLSVLHSHLLAGASLVVTDLSVVDRCFWERVRDERVTTLAGVPYTFECLDRIGFAEFDLPALRSVTQAGGRLDPERVRAYAELGRRRGWSFTVMYGQTEATARMAVLPAELAASHPTAIGWPIPGGELRIDPVAGAPDGTGELVYRGPNVMLGYAERPADLALGRTVDELRTGDLGRALPDGLFEVTGRLSSFVKIAGVRIDLEHAERRLVDDGLRAAVAGVDGQLVVAVDDHGADPDILRERILDRLPVPSRAVVIVPVEAIPRRPNGKPDRAAVRALVDDPSPTASSPTPAVATPDQPLPAIRALYAESVGRPVDDRASFTSLGGDSLSYVHVSLGLEDVLGRLPDGWPTMAIADLAAVARPRPTRSRWRSALTWRTVEMSLVLRALAILAIVSQHSGYWIILGGAHVLVAVAGYNFARFQLTPAPRTERLRSQLRAIGRIVVPTVLWIGAMLLLTTDYGLQNLVLANAIVGTPTFDPTWHFWFVEMLVYVLIGMAILLAIPFVDRLERRWPFGLAMTVLGIGLAIRFDLVDPGLTQPRPILWLFAIGWAAGVATSWWQRAAIAAVAILAVPGFYAGDVQREAIITGGLVALIAIRRVRIPGPAVRAVGILASASLFIYLVHWQIWPRLPDAPRDLVVWACLAAGVLLWAVSGWTSSRLRRWWPPRLSLGGERSIAPETLAPAPLRLTSR